MTLPSTPEEGEIKKEEEKKGPGRFRPKGDLYHGHSWLVKELALRGDFIKEDVEIFLHALETLIYETASKEEGIFWDGVWKMSIKSTRAHRMFNFKKNEWYMAPDHKRVVFTVSKKLSAVVDPSHYPYGSEENVEKRRQELLKKIEAREAEQFPDDEDLEKEI